MIPVPDPNSSKLNDLLNCLPVDGTRKLSRTFDFLVSFFIKMIAPRVSSKSTKSQQLQVPSNISDAYKNTTRQSLSYEDLLPTFYHDLHHNPKRTTDDLNEFFTYEFGIKRLNNIHGYLWLAGRLMPARPLHQQIMMSC